VSESGTHVAVAQARARARAGVPGADRATTLAAIQAALAEVPDPELPVLSVVDLGIVHRVELDADGIDVTILPTFVGCPALDVIRASIAERLGVFGRPVRVDTTFEVPWTSERISPAGRRALATVGIAPPSAPDAVRCPFCRSGKVAMDSAFGPTQCRSLYYCRGCRQPFEALKAV
jgi:ring-1,2-phenylacetyl-CoA epoxidase subunit PaaD